MSIGIYVHFPFCVSKCNYCNFNSYSDKNHLQLDYLKALTNEIKKYADKKVDIDTIFIGGGTPSFMFDGCISTLLSTIKKSFNVLIDAEITIECNPNSVTSKKVYEWKDSGINRVSVGLQSTNANTLKLIGRCHTVKDYVNAIETIKTCGINNINTDCLVGLPRQKLSHIKHTLRLITKFECTHVSVYSLILEEDTPLFKLVNDGEVCLPSEEKVLNMYNFAYEYLEKNGYHRYEVSNFAKDAFECKHNLNTWKMGEYLGFGAGAHSYFKGVRYNNVLSIDEYINYLKNDDFPIEQKEKISNQEKYEETIMLGLRTKFGVNINDLKNNFKVDILKTKEKEINELLNENLIVIINDFIIPTDLGFTVLNKIILDLV